MATYETYETEEDYDTMAEPNVNEATPTVRLKNIAKGTTDPRVEFILPK